MARASARGATPVRELYITYSKIHDLLKEAGLSVVHAYVGNYFTSLEMMGITVTLMKVDDELKELIKTDCESMGLTQSKLP